MSSTAPGTVIVISSARMPPSAMASTTARSLLGSFDADDGDDAGILDGADDVGRALVGNLVRHKCVS